MRSLALGTMAAMLLVLATATLPACWGAPDRDAGDSGRAANAPVAATPSAPEPVPLPDLARVAPEVREPIERAHAAVTAGAGRGGTSSVDLALAYGELGKLLLAAEFGQSAEFCFLRASSLAPTERRWPYYLGHVYRAQGETTKSTASFKRALELSPDDVPTLVWLGESYLAEDRLDEAAAVFSRAQTLDSTGASAPAGLGRVALAQRSYAEAVRRLEEALTRDNSPSGIHYALALAYRGLGHVDKAEPHMAQRGTGAMVAVRDPLMDDLRRLPTSTNTYESRGIQALEAGDHVAAAEQFRKGLERSPNDASLHHRLGTALVLSGDVTAGQREFEAALKLAPDLARAHYSLGVLFASKGQLRLASERLVLAVRHDPSYAEARLLLGDIFRHMGRAKEALEQYEAVTRLDPRIAEAQLGHALARADLGEYRQAADELVRAGGVFPDRPDLTLALARLRAAAPDPAVRDGARAVTLMQHLLGLDPQAGPDVLEAMAMAYAEAGNYQEAVTWQRQAMESAERSGRGADMVREMQVNLDSFLRGEPSRNPWADYAVP